MGQAKRVAFGLLALVAVGCGMTPTGSNPGTTTNQPVITPPSQQQPSNPQILAAIQRDVAAAYQSVNTLSAIYDDHQSKGSDRYYATHVVMKFAKPRKLRLEIGESSDSLLSGAMVVWTGGNSLSGRKDLGPIHIRQTNTLQEKPCLRGWLLNQTDYDAMVQALMQGLPRGRYLGTGSIGGQTLVMVEVPSALSGVTVERIGLDPRIKLPVYREVHETEQGPAVFTMQYGSVQVNPSLPADTFVL
jgi:outer membrane lipoprotein-sorting protein